MRNFEDYIGKRFGRLVAVEEVPSLRTQSERYYRCACDCGAMRIVSRSNLRQSHTRSCGCLNLEKIAARTKTHGMSITPEYRAWNAMRNRCRNPNDPAYAHYGGRGITVCEEWEKSFDAFYAHIGPRPAGRSLDRIDNDGNYEPGNVRWATRQQQAMNQRQETTCRRGHPFSHTKKSGQRACRICSNEAQRRRRAKAK